MSFRIVSNSGVFTNQQSIRFLAESTWKMIESCVVNAVDRLAIGTAAWLLTAIRFE